MLTVLEEAVLPPSDQLLSVRSGKLKNLGKGGLVSGIDKQPLQGPVQIGSVGIPGDEIEYVYHGGPEKALHQYCAGHYQRWRQEKPEKSQMFKIGAFGENIALEHMDEENVCIGDIYSIGREVIVQITEPRYPCFKLNARFEWPQAAKRVTKTGRIGWYLRILQTGTVKEGDTMTLTKRLNPRWSITNTMSVLMRSDVDDSLVTELSKIEGLGKETRGMAMKKLNGGEAENAMARMKGGAFDWNSYKVVDAQMITPRVRELTLVYNGPKDRYITETDLVAHAYVRLRFGPDKSIERSYSVVSGDLDKFVLGIALDDNSRGGSAYIHKELKVQDHVDVVRGATGEEDGPPADFDKDKVRHIFIIGGIGVTAFLREIDDLKEKKARVEVHYACRSMEDAAYKDKLPSESTTYYAKDRKERLNIDKVIPAPGTSGKHEAMIYICGPNSLMDAGEARCQKLKYPKHLLHFESFGAPTSGELGDPFEVDVEDLDSERKSSVTVSAEQSLLDTLMKAGFDVPYSCKAGRCGICVVNVKCGQVDHKGTGLLEEAKATSMLSCVSRGKGKLRIEIE